MAGHSRPKDGVASLAYVPAIHAFLLGQAVDARHKAGHDGGETGACYGHLYSGIAISVSMREESHTTTRRANLRSLPDARRVSR